MTLTTIHLGGVLGRMFGKKWELYVNSPAEAIRAIDVNVGGRLREYLSTKGSKKYYKVAVQNKNNLLSKDEIGGRTGSGDIFILPTIRGAGDDGGLLQIIIGVVLIVATWGAATAGVIAYGSTAATIGFGLGASMVLGGIVQMLTPQPKMTKDKEGKGSTLFPGGAVAIEQGNAVPLIYGRILTSAVPINISINNYQESNKSQADIEFPVRIDLPDGSFYYQ
jgi:predicted phage tail protein